MGGGWGWRLAIKQLLWSYIVGDYSHDVPSAETKGIRSSSLNSLPFDHKTSAIRLTEPFSPLREE